MKKSLLLLILLLPFTLKAVTNDDKKINFFTDTYLGFSYTPKLFFLKDKAPASNTSFVYNSNYSQAFGFEFVKPLGEKLLLNLGLQYNTIGFTRTEYCNTCGEVDYTPEVFSRSRYISVPVGFNYLITNERLDIVANAGIDNSFLRGVKSKRLEYNGEYSQSMGKGGFNNWIFGLYAGIGFNYTMNYNMSFGMSLNYYQPLTQITLSPEMAAFGMGISSAFYYKF